MFEPAAQTRGVVHEHRILPRGSNVRGDALADCQQPVPVPRANDTGDDEALNVADVRDLLLKHRRRPAAGEGGGKTRAMTTALAVSGQGA